MDSATGISRMVSPMEMMSFPLATGRIFGVVLPPVRLRISRKSSWFGRSSLSLKKKRSSWASGSG